MDKAEFTQELRNKLSGLPQNEVDDRIMFYSEMIEDRVEEGATEEEVISELGSVEGVAKQIIAEVPITSIVKEKIQPKRKMGALEIILLILGSPIWISILITLFAVIISIYAALWSIVIALWASFVAFAVCALAGPVGIIIYACSGKLLSGVALLGAGIACGGFAILMFYLCVWVTKIMIRLTKKISYFVKRKLVGRANENDKI